MCQKFSVLRNWSTSILKSFFKRQKFPVVFVKLSSCHVRVSPRTEGGLCRVGWCLGRGEGGDGGDGLQPHGHIPVKGWGQGSSGGGVDCGSRGDDGQGSWGGVWEPARGGGRLHHAEWGGAASGDGRLLDNGSSRDHRLEPGGGGVKHSGHRPVGGGRSQGDDGRGRHGEGHAEAREGLSGSHASGEPRGRGEVVRRGPGWSQGGIRDGHTGHAHHGHGRGEGRWGSPTHLGSGHIDLGVGSHGGIDGQLLL